LYGHRQGKKLDELPPPFCHSVNFAAGCEIGEIVMSILIFSWTENCGSIDREISLQRVNKERDVFKLAISLKNSP